MGGCLYGQNVGISFPSSTNWDCEMFKSTHDLNYWSNDILSIGPGAFTDTVMSRKRIMNILKFLRFAKHSSAALDDIPNNCLAMFIVVFREINQILVYTGDIFAVDECLVLCVSVNT